MTTTRARVHRRRLALVALSLMVLSACRTGQQQWGPFRAQVIDAEAGTAIAGAHVRVSWTRAGTDPVHTNNEFYDARETVTNAEGQFEIPRLRRVDTILVGEPVIGIFAPRYLKVETAVTPSNGRPYVDPTVVKMRRLKTRAEECHYKPSLAGVPTAATPRFVDAVHAYVTKLDCRY